MKSVSDKIEDIKKIVDEILIGEEDDDYASRVPGIFTNQYVIVRTYSAGVFAGTLIYKEGKEVLLSNARRLWSWQGAASLSQLASSGTSKPNECKFPEEVEKVLLTEAIEILKVSAKARKSIDSVPVWEE